MIPKLTKNWFWWLSIDSKLIFTDLDPALNRDDINRYWGRRGARPVAVPGGLAWDWEQNKTSQSWHNDFTLLGAGQTKGFRPLLDVFTPSIYRIFRASQNANRWCIINQKFAKSLPLDARVKKYR